MKRRQLLWMLVPCLFLAGVAWTLRVRENTKAALVTAANAAPSGRFQLVIKSIEKVSPDPDDVADGYDTKVRVMLGHTGKAPPRWGSAGFGGFFSDTRLLVKRRGKWVRLMDNIEKQFRGHGVATRIYTFYSNTKRNDVYQFAFNLRLREVPATYGELALQSDWFYRASKVKYSVVGQPSFAFLRRMKAPHATARLSVRRAGEKIILPQVSRDPQIEVRRVIVRALTTAEKTEYAGHDTKVEFHGARRAKSPTC